MFRYSTVIIGLAGIVLPLHAQLDEGGPDGYGYYYESTQDPGDSVCFAWLSPAGHTPVTSWMPDPDDGWATIPLPGRFPVYGDTLDSIVVCTNGFLEYPTTSVRHLNTPLPFSSIPLLIAPFWDDLNPAASGEVLRYDDPAGAFTVVTWRNVVRFGTFETLSCQVTLFADGRIRFDYLRIPANSRSSTIGIQGSCGADGRYLEYVWDGLPVRHVPRDSTSIVFFLRRLRSDVGIQSITSPAGWVPTGQQVPVSATVRNYGLDPATFPVRALILRGRYPRDTLYDRSLNVTGIAPGDTFHCYFGDFLTSPNPDSWRVVFRTNLVGDQHPRNDTAAAVAFSAPPAFGSVLAAWDFPTLGNGLNLAGISFCPDSNRFYFAANDPNRIYSFPSADPTALRYESFELQNFFGDDIIWGIAWDDGQPGFWLTHTSERGTGCVLARHHADGAFTGDTWDITGILPDVWLAGIDCGPDNTLYATGVGAGNHIYHLDPVGRSILGWLGSPAASWRACSWIGDHAVHLLTGGWNRHLMIQLDCSGSITRSASAPDLADIDVYRPMPPPADSFIWIYRTRNNQLNTIERVSLGVLWSGVAIGEPATGPELTPALEVAPNPAFGDRVALHYSQTDLPGRLELRDIAGRLLSAMPVVSRDVLLTLTDADGRRLAAGIYLLRLTTRSATVSRKLVLATGR